MKLVVPLLLALFAAAQAHAQAAPGAGGADGPAAGTVVVAPTVVIGPAGVTGGAMAAPEASAINDYPTEARAEYVFACMATNGRSADTLRRCSCSIDVIASIVPYDDYVEAETVLAMMQTTGERVEAMRSAPPAKAFVQTLRRAQAEGSVRCF
ncbi:MAG: hypothetical protein QM699_08835 [Amaricoccus sp.]|uniref:hypothetical protein n=1 Tax=Amaricoccus sp. TaxID=1872485 RepID=UPI0039E37AB7